MARRCENCIHDKVCDMWAVDSGIPFVNADTCEHYKPTADVAPKSEVALDVIRKVKNKVRKYKQNAVNPYEHIMLYLNELEKKYTEDQNNEN